MRNSRQTRKYDFLYSCESPCKQLKRVKVQFDVLVREILDFFKDQGRCIQLVVQKFLISIIQMNLQ